MNYLDLFAGIGGFALGAYWAGWRFDRHYFSEIDPWCCKLYQRRFPDAVPLGDIRVIDGAALMADPEHGRREHEPCNASREGNSSEIALQSGDGWVITGGFPCQDISVAGKGAGIHGERSGLWFEYARLIGEIRPRYAIMENVGALTRRGLDAVLGSLAEIGYDAEWSDIRASDVGAPHRRERIWIVAYPYESGREIYRGVRERWSESWIRKETSDEYSPGSGTEQWAIEPNVGRVAHGVPARVDRLRGLGNSIVPQIAELIFRQLTA